MRTQSVNTKESWIPVLYLSPFLADMYMCEGTVKTAKRAPDAGGLIISCINLNLAFLLTILFTEQFD